ELDGSIDLQGESQLVQKRYTPSQFSESIFDEDSEGYIERDQQGQKNSFNYNYWSSPVSPQGGLTNNAPYSVGSILKDGTNSASYLDINFGDGAYFADFANSGSIKISNRWIWSYNSPTPASNTDWQNYYQWKYIASYVPIKAGEGYTMKGTGGAADIGVLQNYVFVGKPHSGVIPNLSIATEDTYLIGNPYPSALDADEFILDNLSVANGGRNTIGNIFNGALYFWDHFTNTDNHLLAQYTGGYATYNLIGQVEAIADLSLGINNNAHGLKVPERYIPVGQAFFIEGSIDPDLAETVSVNGGPLVFKNSQRVFKREGVTTTNSGSVFMKGVKAKGTTTVDEEYVDSRPKIRLQFDSPLGYQRKLLVGVDKRTTNKFDIGFDAQLNEDNKEDMFWQLGKVKLVIQGVNNFNEDQELPLGLKISKAGLASIKIEDVKNIDENTTLHIKDKLTGLTHNISHRPFEIELEPGEYLDRFALVFKMYKLVADDVDSGILLVEPIIEDHNYHVFMNNALAELQIKNNGTDEIKSVALYNNLGQTMKIWHTELNRRIISLPVKLATGVYMVQINTINGTINKRIIIE
ncbi:MAG: T9SS type A sorting domain-containing protein, partial [Lutibacter sp.]|nr:T9SS type A sorting domain-containing protein [Lutibacter sp.]